RRTRAGDPARFRRIPPAPDAQRQADPDQVAGTLRPPSRQPRIGHAPMLLPAPTKKASCGSFHASVFPCALGRAATMGQAAMSDHYDAGILGRALHDADAGGEEASGAIGMPRNDGFDLPRLVEAMPRLGAVLWLERRERRPAI